MTVKNMTEAHAREHNREQLGKIIASTYQFRAALSDDMITNHCKRIAAAAEHGTLSHEDSLILGAFVVSTVRNCI